MAALSEAGLDPGRVMFTGYVGESEKVGLLYNAAFCIYPSFFEGYGLPIVEAAALGKLIVCSNTSSMPEVAPDHCFFFDPADMAQFSRAMAMAEKRALQLRPPQSLADVADGVARAGWGACYDAIANWVKS
jgi:glycosyltransferase involved in cell wall biosynthesis